MANNKDKNKNFKLNICSLNIAKIGYNKLFLMKYNNDKKNLLGEEYVNIGQTIITETTVIRRNICWYLTNSKGKNNCY